MTTAESPISTLPILWIITILTIDGHCNLALSAMACSLGITCCSYASYSRTVTLFLPLLWLRAMPLKLTIAPVEGSDTQWLASSTGRGSALKPIQVLSVLEVSMFLC